MLLAVFGLVNVCFALVIGPLQTMINAAAAGSTVNVPAGIYNEMITIDKPLTVKGHSAADTFIITSAPGGQGGVAIIAPDVHISGFTVHGGTGTDVSAIIVGGIITDDVTDYHVSGVVIQKCILERSSVGLFMHRATGTKILNNIIRYNTNMNADFGGTGIVFWPHSDTDLLGTQITGNTIYDNDGYGIWIQGAGYSLDGTKLTNNTLFNNGADDLTPPSNNKKYGFLFSSATGVITMTGNKILATWPPGNELMIGGTVSGLTGTGNKIFPILKPAGLTGSPTTKNLP
jgi:parallel beta-helix repeat protein